MKAKRNLGMLPPTNYTLELHNFIKRKNYQAKICLQTEHAILNLDKKQPTVKTAGTKEQMSRYWFKALASNLRRMQDERRVDEIQYSTASLKCTPAGGCEVIDCANPMSRGM